ncbi:M23 family metallopeptidase [Sneathiella sp.]|uniref:M23 family metallopeptidase n=1 Tax=Sneathiella sp. TaxID=1964365 RepID=UPI00356614C0
MSRLAFVLALLLLPWPAQADAVVLKGDFVQGGLVIGNTTPSDQVFLDEKRVEVSANGWFVFGFGWDFKDTASLKIRHKDGAEEAQTFKIDKRVYKTEEVTGLPPSKVTPSKEFLARIRKENGEIARIRGISTDKDWFLSGWDWPAEGRISGVFGSQRVLNGVPKRPHFGLDIAAPVGTAVVASTDGTVRLVETDLFYTGGTIMIDHGHGLVSVYSHLSQLNVTVGQFVAQGTKIGEIGMTGRATGPHLDWRLNWFDQRLDPELLLKKVPQN